MVLVTRKNWANANLVRASGNDSVGLYDPWSTFCCFQIYHVVSVVSSCGLVCLGRVLSMAPLAHTCEPTCKVALTGRCQDRSEKILNVRPFEKSCEFLLHLCLETLYLRMPRSTRYRKPGMVRSCSGPRETYRILQFHRQNVLLCAYLVVLFVPSCCSSTDSPAGRGQ